MLDKLLKKKQPIALLRNNFHIIIPFEYLKEENQIEMLESWQVLL